MNLTALQKTAVDALENVKAQEIRVFDTTAQTSLFDRIIVASGTSNRQTRALANEVSEQVKKAGGHVNGMEGEETGEWILVDLGDIVVHVMQPAIRSYYRLEEIWGEKEIPVKPAKATSRTKKAVDAAPLDAEAPVKKPRARKTAVVTDTPADAPVKKPRTRKVAATTEASAVAKKLATRTQKTTAATTETPPPRAPRRKTAA